MSLLGSLIIISAPSGGGKTSLVKAIVQQLPGLRVSVSHTTRAPRAGEVEGIEYFFVDEPTFKAYQQEGLFLESATVFNNFYGTSKKWVQDNIKQGVDVILEIDWQGARHVKSQMDCVSIFLLPPSKEVLFERLNARKQDSREVIEKRMNKANEEISHYKEYDYLVVNDDFVEACDLVVAIIKANRACTARQKQQYARLLASFEL